MNKEVRPANRLVTLDLMRGYFIFVIIIDHLMRWPGVFDWFTGQGRLWVSAAEGFIGISGLLIGMVRGRKDSELPFIFVTKKLWKRAGVLYLWAIICTASVYFFISRWGANITPYPPGIDSFSPGVNDYLEIATFQATFGWTIFLMYYAVFLLFTPLVVYLLRKNYWWLVIILSVAVWIAGCRISSMFLSWQLLFFLGAVLGYYFKEVTSFFRNLRHRDFYQTLLYTFTALTLAASIFTIFAWPLVKADWFPISYEAFLDYRTYIDPFFVREMLMPVHLLLVATWLSTLYMLTKRFETQIVKYTGWLLLPFGKRSLFVYILQGFVVILINIVVPPSTNILFNALVTIGTLLLLLQLTKVKFLHKIIPS